MEGTKAKREALNTAGRLHGWQLVAKHAGLHFLVAIVVFFKLT